MLVPRYGRPEGLPEKQLWREDAGEPLQAPTPAQVVGQILSRLRCSAFSRPGAASVARLGACLPEGRGKNVTMTRAERLLLRMVLNRPE